MMNMPFQKTASVHEVGRKRALCLIYLKILKWINSTKQKKVQDYINVVLELIYSLMQIKKKKRVDFQFGEADRRNSTVSGVNEKEKAAENIRIILYCKGQLGFQ